MLNVYAPAATVTLQSWNLALDSEHENLIITVNGEHIVELDGDAVITFLDEIDPDPESVDVLETIGMHGDVVTSRHLTIVFDNALDCQQLHADIAGGTFLEDLGLIG